MEEMIMKVETIISIVTAGIAFITSILSFSYNIVQANKARIQKVILENRIQYLHEIRDGFSCFIGLCNTEAIEFAKSDSNVMKSYAEKLFIGYGKMKTHIKPFYEIDKELVNLLDTLYSCVLSELNGNSEEVAQLDVLRELFSSNYLKYDWAYWKYIQAQKDGRFLNSDDAFDKVYYDFIASIGQ